MRVALPWCLLLLALPARAPADPPDPVILDADGDRLLVGHLDPVPPGTDTGLRLRVRLRVGGVETTWALADRDLVQAGFAGSGRILATTLDGDLLEVDPARGKPRLLDRGVVGAVGASPDGRHLVYCKGEPPELEVWRLDRPGGTPRPVTKAMAPAWSPAVSPDGRTVVFTSARSGVPALWIVEDDGPPRQLTNVGAAVAPAGTAAPSLAPFPAAMSPVRLAGGWIAFEGRGAVHVFTVRGAHHRTLPGAAPHWIEPGRVLGVVVGTPPRVERLVLPEKAP